MAPLTIIILAAGQGTRMHSALPKVLHPVADKPLLAHVIATAQQLAPHDIFIVYGHGGEQVRACLNSVDVVWINQAQQLGTGHAVAQALPKVRDDAQVLVLYGDVPLIQTATLCRLVAASTTGLGILTAELPDPTGYGRIVRDAAGRVVRIVEEKDASVSERALREINTGFLAAPAGRLKKWVAALDNSNAQGEFYLTDVVASAVRDGVPITTVMPEDSAEILGVNNRAQLAAVERIYQRRMAHQLMLSGVTLRDPARCEVRGTITAGRDCVIDINSILEGAVTLGERVTIGAHCHLRDVTLGDDVVVLDYTLIEEAQIGAGARIGPYARIRPDTTLAAGAHIGNFVEIKKTSVGAGSKINHLSYIGDATVGARVNIGAGTITCNYDGINKHHTLIEDDAFIGSDTQLVAPVTIGTHATIGAGSTITKNAPADALTLSRARQETRLAWRRPVKNADG